jgi:hypothetical protein
MIKRLFIATIAAGGLAASTAAAHPGHHGHAAPATALPDFPSYARPGECWARVPAGGAASPGQSVWTLRKGAGPGAVWSYSERPAPGATTQGADLEWAQVDCAGRRSFGMAHAGPPPPSMPPMLPGAHHHAAPLPPAPPPPIEFVPPAHPPLHGMGHGMQHGPAPDLGPYADGPGMGRPDRYGPGRDVGSHAPPPFFDRPPAPPQFTRRAVAPRWFGDRRLTWSGKGR